MWQTRGGEAQGSCQLESPNRSPRHLSANRELSPIAICACQPSAAAPRPRPLRCGLLSQDHAMSRLRRWSGAEWGRTSLGLDMRGRLGQPHGRPLRCERD